jgi:hypothetical protein
MNSKINAVLKRLGWVQVNERFRGLYWELGESLIGLPSEENPSWHSIYQDMLVEVACVHGMAASDVERIIKAEPDGALREFGYCHLQGQEQDEFGFEDHGPATLHLSPTGRDRLIAALIEGRKSIDFHGEGGGGYSLAIEIHPNKF